MPQTCGGINKVARRVGAGAVELRPTLTILIPSTCWYPGSVGRVFVKLWNPRKADFDATSPSNTLHASPASSVVDFCCPTRGCPVTPLGEASLPQDTGRGPCTSHVPLSSGNKHALVAKVMRAELPERWPDRTLAV